MRIWLVRTALESVECRAWTMQTTITRVTGRWNMLLDASWKRVDSRLVTIDEQVIKSRECQHFSLLLLSALCLVDDSAAVGLLHVWTRDRMMSFW